MEDEPRVSSDGEYEWELTADRAEIAAELRGVVDGVLAGAIRLGEGAEAVSVGVAEELDLEIELEAEDDGWSLELELDWDATEDEPAAPTRGAQSAKTNEEPAAPPSGAQPAETNEEPAAPPSGAQPAETGEEPAAPGGARPAETDEEAGLAAAADTTQSVARFEVYTDAAGEWRWRLRHRNGNVIATSGEGYTRKHNAQKGLRSVMANSPAADVIEEPSN